MMSNTVQIFIDNYSNACYPGQTLAGRVECFFYEEKTIRAVRVKFRGIAQTHWTESEKYYDDFFKEERTRNVSYTGEELYFNQEYNLVGGHTELRIQPGKHSYPFSYILPLQLPSSFQDNYGRIEYSITATVDCPWRFDDEAKVVLNLISPLDLNYVPRLGEPAATSVEKTLCSCWCNSSDTLSFDISLPVTGYVPGQEVNIGAYVQNMTNVSAERVNFKIVKDLEFIANFPSRRTQRLQDEITSCVEGGIGAHGEKSWTSVLTIPRDYYPNLLPCSLINITYTLKAKVVIPFPHTNLGTELPLTIGDIPLSGVNTAMPCPPPQTNLNATAPPSDNASLLPNMGAPYSTYSSEDATYLASVSGGATSYQATAPSTIPPIQPSAPVVGWMPADQSIDTASAPPSYAEAQQLREKNEKAEP